MADRPVTIRICFLLMGDIDTKAQKFTAEVLIEATYVRTLAQEGAEGAEGGEEWDPRLVVTNLESTSRESRRYEHKRDRHSGIEYTTLHWRLKGEFFERMELKHFPRDVQDMSVKVSSLWGARDIDLRTDQSRLATLDRDNFRDEQEWELYSHVDTEHVPEDLSSLIQRGYPAGRIIATCRVARRAKFFLVNNVFIMFSLIMLSLTCFAFDPVWDTSRIGATMTLLLVSVAFKLSVAGTLPLISYLTYLDIYILGGMLYLVVMTVLFAFISPFKNDADVARKIDIACVSILSLAIVLFHVIYGLIFYFDTNKRIMEMKAKDTEYDARLEKMKIKIEQRSDNSPDQRPPLSPTSIGSPRDSTDDGNRGFNRQPSFTGAEHVEVRGFSPLPQYYPKRVSSPDNADLYRGTRRPTFREEEV